MVAQQEILTFTTLNLRYWQRWVETIGLANVAQLDNEQQNLFKAASLGLRLSATAPHSAQLISDLFELIRQRHYWADWLPLIEHAIDIPTLSEKLTVDLLNQAGLLLHLLQKNGGAVAKHQLALALAQSAQLTYQQLVTHTNLSNAYLGSHQYELAQAHAAEAKRIIGRLPILPKRNSASVHNCLGLIALEKGMLESAIQNLLTAAELFAQVNDIAFQATALSNLGVAYIRNKQLALAVEAFYKAYGVLEFTSFELEKVRVWINLGAYFAKLEQYEQALHWFQLADTPYLWHSVDYRQQAFVLHNLGYAYVKLSRSGEGIIYLERAESLWRSLDDKLHLGNTLMDLGYAQAAVQDPRQAVISLKQAVHHLSLFPDNAWAHSLILKATQKLKILGDGVDDT
ncbi:MAG: tetratricopeptide repeat protein [Candidatus Promineifilaceae bacterium]